jgi:hypothetical protein
MADYLASNGTGIRSNLVSEGRISLDDYLKSSPAFTKNVEDTFNELQALLLKKHIDYGPKNISESPGGPVNGLRVRMHDKLARINNLVDKGVDNPQYESLEDSFKDLANYAIIGLLVLRNQWGK